MNVAIIKAGGTGSRIQNDRFDIPKQFIEVKGKPIIIYSIEPLQNAENVDRIIISCHSDYIDLCWDYVRKFGITKVTDIVEGGKTTIDSFNNAFDVVKDEMTDEDIIIMNDAVRPLYATETIEEIVEAAKKYNAAGGGARVPECTYSTPFKQNSDFEYLGSDNVMVSKAPQAIKLGEYNRCKKAAIEMGIYDNCPTPCTLTQNTGRGYRFIPDSPYNIKITYDAQLDFFIAVVEAGIYDQIIHIH